MRLLIKFPTRQRPRKFLKVLQKYVDYSASDNYKIIVSCDHDDPSMQGPSIREALAQYKNLTFCLGDHQSKIEAINADVDKCDHFDILLLASDDMIPVVQGYDDIIRQDMATYYPDGDGVLWYFDHHRNNLNTLPILGKKYYDRFGYIYYPGYKSFFCDNEFMQVAQRLEKQQYLDRLIIEHQHPEMGYKWDTVYEKNHHYLEKDERLFYERQQNHFGLGD